MNIAHAIMYLCPSADPMKDFIVQYDGFESILREGASEKGKVRYEIKQPDEGEQPIEGIHYRYGIDYNLLAEGDDYDLVERGPYIAVWNLETPQPTEAELITAWEAYQKSEANKPPEEPSKLEKLQQELAQTQIALADNYEQLLSVQQEATSAQLALADLYEQVLPLLEGDK